MSESKSDNIKVFGLNAYIKPDIKETSSQEWVLNGKANSFYQYTIDRFNGSPTNAAVINSYVDLIYGKGLTNTNGNAQGWLQFKRMFSDADIRRIVSDYKLFGEAIVQVIPANGRGELPICYHMPKELTAPQKRNEDNEIEGYYYCENWVKVSQNPPEFFPIFEDVNTRKASCYPIKPYKSGKIYFSDPDYLAGMQYAELEEEISNYYISHIKNGLSFGYIINIPNGSAYSPEEKNDIERKIKRHLTGSSQAGKFVINFGEADAKVEVTAIEVNSAHKQWEYLTSEARQQIMTAHRVTSPMLFGIKDSTGLGNNADELDTAEAQLMKRVINPSRRFITEQLENIAAICGISLDLRFKSLSDEAVTTDISMSKPHPVDELIALGSDSLDGYDLVATEISEDEPEDVEIQLASTGTARPNAKSSQDSDDIVIRYRYVGNPNPQREFCKRMMSANKLYRKEDIVQMGSKVVNPGFGYVAGGQSANSPYSIWEHKGGGLLSDNFPYGTCRHKWQREIYLKKGVNVDVNSPLAEKISTTKARSMGYKVPTNEGSPFAAPHDRKG